MWFEFCFRDGWYKLVKKLCEDIQGELDKEPDAKWVKLFELVQAKEKFGGLRWYVTAASQRVHDLILKAEEESCHICEVCGAKGRTRGLSWIQTLCAEHFQRELRK